MAELPDSRHVVMDTRDGIQAMQDEIARAASRLEQRQLGASGTGRVLRGWPLA